MDIFGRAGGRAGAHQAYVHGCHTNPPSKHDQVAIPEFAMGAMENWGLVTYREVDLLIDERKASSQQKQRVATVVAHELAHQCELLFWWGGSSWWLRAGCGVEWVVDWWGQVGMCGVCVGVADRLTQPHNPFQPSNRVRESGDDELVGRPLAQ